MCVTESEAFFVSLPTRSTVVYPGCRNRFEISATHFGSVALNSRVCNRALPLAASRINSMSSTNPMFSISSASSNTRNRKFVKLRVLRSKWSFIRPGVPMTISVPARNARSCSP